MENSQDPWSQLIFNYAGGPFFRKKRKSTWTHPRSNDEITRLAFEAEFFRGSKMISMHDLLENSKEMELDNRGIYSVSIEVASVIK